MFLRLFQRFNANYFIDTVPRELASTARCPGVKLFAERYVPRRNTGWSELESFAIKVNIISVYKINANVYFDDASGVLKCSM